MKKLLIFSLTAALAAGCFAADNIYRGNSTAEGDFVCCYQGGRFYSDAARKNQIYHHPGNMVSKEAKATLQNSIYRLMGNKLYKGASTAKEDCLATIVETSTKKGDTLSAKIYEGFIVPRDEVKSYDKATKIETVTSCKLTGDGINEIQPKILFTIANNKVYRGDSTDDKDCLLTYTGAFTAGRLLFIAYELTK